MDDLVLQAQIDEFTTVKVSPIDSETYAEFIEDDTLGGSRGYFVVRSSRKAGQPRFEVLAKAASFEAAGEIFAMIVKAATGRTAYASA